MGRSPHDLHPHDGPGPGPRPRPPVYRAPDAHYWPWIHRPSYWAGFWPYYRGCHWHAYHYRPWAWVTWPSLTLWFGYAPEPIYYNYYVYGGYVYNGDAQLATVTAYAGQAAQIAALAPAPPEDVEWLPLGVFALSPDETAQPPVIVQLAVTKDGAVGGTYYYAEKGITLDLAGSIDKKTQRVAWRVGGDKGVLMETGLDSLTRDRSAVLIHFPEGTTENWVMTRVNEEAAKKAEGLMRSETARLDLAASWDFLQRSLDDAWKAYFALPPLDAADRPPDPEALGRALARFDKIAADPQYRVVAELPGFHTTRKLLEQYVRERPAPQP